MRRSPEVCGRECTAEEIGPLGAVAAARGGLVEDLAPCSGEPVRGAVQDVDASCVDRLADVFERNADREVAEAISVEVSGCESRPEGGAFLEGALDAADVLVSHLVSRAREPAVRGVQDVYRARIGDAAKVFARRADGDVRKTVAVETAAAVVAAAAAGAAMAPAATQRNARILCNGRVETTGRRATTGEGRSRYRRARSLRARRARARSP